MIQFDLMKLLKKGAEGDLYLAKFNGHEAILKVRKKKTYRNHTLDEKIRKQRTVREASILSEIKEYGVRSPLVYFVDVKNCTILMQYIRGIVVSDLRGRKLASACREIGNITAVLHNNGIMHGDLTTSNFILAKTKTYVIDFGLSQKTSRIEDHAVDLRLFKEILNSAHVEQMDELWQSFLCGYRCGVGTGRFNNVLSYVSVIEGRGRYANVV